MSVGTVGTAGIGSLPSQFSPARTTGSTTRIDDLTRNVSQDQQKVDDTKVDAERKSQAAHRAGDEFKAAEAAVARDQAQLNVAKSQAKFDVYT